MRIRFGAGAGRGRTRTGSCSLGRRRNSAPSALLIGLLGLVLAWPVSPPHAHGQETPLAAGPATKSGAPPEALEHYERGRTEYLGGRYREALVELRAALELDPSSPNLVYNVARVYEDLGELDQAIKYYHRYRTLLPLDAAPEREKTSKTIRRLEGARDEQTQAELDQAKEEPVVQTAPPSTDADHGSGGSGRADLAFWLVASTGVALAAGGGVTGWLALRREKEVGDFVLGKDGTFEKREKLRKDANRFALVSDVAAAAAGAALLTAALLFFSRDSDPDEPEVVKIVPNGVVVAF